MKKNVFMYKPNLSQRLKFVFWFALFVLTLVFIISYYSTISLIYSTDRVDHSDRFLLKLESIFLILKNAESGQRAFLVSGNNSFLEPYYGSHKKVNKSYKQICFLNPDNTNQKKRLETLQTLIDQKYACLESDIEAKKTNKPIINIERCRLIMNQIRSVINSLEVNESNLLKERHNQVKMFTKAITIFIILAFIFGIAILSCSFFMIMNELKARIKSEEETKLSKNKLMEKQHFIQKVADTSPNLLYIHDLIENKNVYANRQLTKTIGYSLKELQKIGDKFLETIVHPDDLPRLKKYLHDFNTAPDGEIRSIELRVKDANGKWRWFRQINTIYLRTMEGAPKQIIGSAQDITSHKAAEEEVKNLYSQLEEKEAFKLQARVLECMSEGVSLSDEKGIILYTNSVEDKIFGYKRGELIGKHISLLNNNLSPQNKNIMNEIKEKGVWQGEIDIRAERVPLILHLKISSLIISGKSYWICIKEDITERKKVEVALRESEERYRTFVKQSTEAIWRFELDKGCIIRVDRPVHEQIHLFYKCAYIAECNDTMAKMYGFAKAEDLIGLRLESLLPASDSKSIKYLTTFISSGYRFIDTEFRTRNIQGNRIYVLSNIIGIVDDGKLIWVWGSQRDITYRKKAQEALKASEEKFKQLADAMPQMVWSALPDGSLDYYNKKWNEYTGLTNSGGRMENWKVVLHPEDVEYYINSWYNSVNIGEPYEEEYRIMNGKTKEYRWFLGRALPIKDNQGNIIRWFGTCTDIHDMKTMQKELLKKNKELSTINRDLDSFVYTASHDLKAPVSNIEGLVNTLTSAFPQDLLKDEDIMLIINFINKSIQKFKETIQDLTDITRIQKNITDEETDVNLFDLIEDIKLSLQEEISISDASIHLNISDCPVIRYSKKELKSIIYNLLSNAIKYKSPTRKPEIYISTEHHGNGILLSFKDNGLGIKAQYKDKIFTMFKRFHNHIEGTGIGLYIVKRIIDNNGGKIEVESEEDKGTSFKIYFKIK